jgi:hypothetical protein
MEQDLTGGPVPHARPHPTIPGPCKPGGNHGAAIYRLPAHDQGQALQQLSAWMGVPLRPYPSAQELAAESEDVPVVNLALERRQRGITSPTPNASS